MKFLKKVWRYFSTYEKIWFLTILVMAVVFSFLFPETDDPTYTLTVLPQPGITSDSEVAVESVFDRLDFTGAEDDFVITDIQLNGETIDLGYDEFTVSPDEEQTLTFRLPVPIAPLDTLTVECYPDGDATLLPITLRGAENAEVQTYSFDLDEAEANPAVSENPLKYFVPVGVITALYLIDVITNIACELMISKQSKWNFMISLAVEITEILICVLCAYRFATLATTILFWIPCDIISFFAWNRHPDREDKNLTVVKKLTAWQDILLLLGVAVWTAVVGYGLTFIDVPGGVFANNVALKNITCYLDACASAVGIANGVFILLRYREQWIAWYLVAILETVINVMAGQWILLVLKAGYLTNTTYGMIRWTKYINTHGNETGKDKASADAVIG